LEPKKVMIPMSTSIQSEFALDYVIKHILLPDDSIILVHIRPHKLHIEPPRRPSLINEYIRQEILSLVH
jgi:hypothetical protein